jgi:hypothetical protein
VRWQIKEVGRVAVGVPLKKAEGGHFRGYRSEEEDKRTKKSRGKARRVGLLRRHVAEREARSRNSKAAGYWVTLPEA